MSGGGGGGAARAASPGLMVRSAAKLRVSNHGAAHGVPSTDVVIFPCYGQTPSCDWDPVKDRINRAKYCAIIRACAVRVSPTRAESLWVI